MTEAALDQLFGQANSLVRIVEIGAPPVASRLAVDGTLLPLLPDDEPVYWAGPCFVEIDLLRPGGGSLTNWDPTDKVGLTITGRRAIFTIRKFATGGSWLPILDEASQIITAVRNRGKAAIGEWILADVSAVVLWERKALIGGTDCYVALDTSLADGLVARLTILIDQPAQLGQMLASWVSTAHGLSELPPLAQFSEGGRNQTVYRMR